MTSNGEREFPAPFLRRCVRYTMPKPTPEMIHDVVRAHLDIDPADRPVAELVGDFLSRLDSGESLAVDQLLSSLFLLAGDDAPRDEHRDKIIEVILRDLSRT